VSTLVEFRPRNSTGAEARVREFIDFAGQELTDVLVSNANYSDVSWNVTRTFVVKGLKGQLRLHFVNSDAKVDRGGLRSDPLAAPFVDFAKASIRYRHVVAPVSYSATNRRVFGLRCVEAAFRDLGRPPEIWHLDPVILNHAVELGTTGKAPSTAYKIGSEIESLYNFCVEMQFLATAFTWSHGVFYPGKASTKIQDLDRRCAGKPPSSNILYAIGEILHASPTWADQIYSHVAALLFAFPIKAHELLQLRVKPEIEVTERGEDREHRLDFGLQIWPGKGHPPQVKWVANPEYTAVAKHAVQTLREMLVPARELARWYEQNPSRLYLSPHHEQLRKAEWLVVSEVQDIVGLSRTAAHQWIDANGIAKRVGERRVSRRRGRGRGLFEVRFGDVERAVLSLLPKDFPYVNGDRCGHRYSEALLVVPVNALHASRSPWKCMFEPIGYEQFYCWLRERIKGVPPAAGET
jgi:hypothetical protein